MRRKSISSKLIFSFLVVAFIAGLIGIIGYIGVHTSNNQYKELAEVSLPTINNLMIVKTEMIAIKASIYKLMDQRIKKQDLIKEFEEIDKARIRYKNALDSYDKINRTQKEDNLYSQFKIATNKAAIANNLLLEKANNLLNYSVGSENYINILDEMDSIEIEKNQKQYISETLNALDDLINFCKNYYAGEIVENGLKLGKTLNFRFSCKICEN